MYNQKLMQILIYYYFKKIIYYLQFESSKVLEDL